MRTRTRARELAMQLLYLAETHGPEEVDTDLFFSGLPAGKEARRYALELYRGTLDSLPRIDERIAHATENWDIHRLAKVDRNILRMAVYELLKGDVPPRVVISEAVELARKFSTEKSSAFVNGVLDRIRKEVQEEENR